MYQLTTVNHGCIFFFTFLPFISVNHAKGGSKNKDLITTSDKLERSQNIPHTPHASPVYIQHTRKV